VSLATVEKLVDVGANKRLTARKDQHLERPHMGDLSDKASALLGGQLIRPCVTGSEVTVAASKVARLRDLLDCMVAVSNAAHTN
jgi:hypothetical protein